MSNDEPEVARNSPTRGQLAFASILGLEIPAGSTKGKVSHLIRVECERRGRKVLRELRPQAGDAIEHPVYGLGKITRVARDTCKVTILVAATNKKVVVNAMTLADCMIATFR